MYLLVVVALEYSSNTRIMSSVCCVVLSANELSSISLDLVISSAFPIGTLVNSAVMSYDLNSSSASILSPVILSANSLEFFTRNSVCPTSGDRT